MSDCSRIEPARSGPLLTYRLDLEYDGTDFHGWQIQPDERTVQECLERAVQTLFHERASVMAAGRTDTGVHATGQVAHFRTASERPPQVVLRALNALLPLDVRVKAVTTAAPDFHARYSACWRAYRYRIATEPTAVGRAYCWRYPHRLDLGRMCDAARYVIGSQRFEAFAHSNPKETHYLSTVHCAEWVRNGPFHEFRIEANRFLHGMVRLLVGTFVRVGRGMLDAAAIPEILASQDVRRAGPKAPAAGLTLVGVGYEPWSAPLRLLEDEVRSLC